MRHCRALIVVLACLSVAAFVAAGAPASSARDVGPTLREPRVGTKVTVYRGRSVPGGRVRLARRTTQGWARFATARADHRGRYRAKAVTPDRTWKVRAVAGDRHSRVRTVTPRPTVAPADEPTPDAEPTDPTTPTPAPTPPPASDACGVRPEKADGSLWSCTFHDDFDGTTLDPTKWTVGETRFSGMTTGNHDCYVNDPQTVSVRDGDLVLDARRELAPFSCPTPAGPFTATSTGATVTSRGRFSQAYGRFAFRARFPETGSSGGPHSALWLYPPKPTYGVWPASGEIDVAEWYGARPANVYPSVHYAGEDPRLSSGYDCAMPTASSAFHTYAVEWTPTVMRFYYDDQLCFKHAWTPSNVTAPAPFDQPFSMVMTQAWGSAWNAPTAVTPDSARMVVTWARAWE